MKSRLVAVLTAATLALTLAACGDSGKQAKEAADKAAAATKEAADKAADATKEAADKAAAAAGGMAPATPAPAAPAPEQKKQ